ncbi:hypothetical protein M8C21_003920 [Ambrosia artemisiifolia]|uniref:Uncharacterized protein n=1 Tax=Ambrosia artemisiifolia TaxID=4212 RepID=A0AAD5G6T0_AMBAR|nr:hypothetical protein M8C21_003920 [Ambrosia artemisiifolia]
MAQFGLMNNGIRVRDPSQMFMFGGSTNWAHESAGLLTKNKSQQAGIFSKPLLGNQSTIFVDQKLCKKEDENQTAVAASSSGENKPCFSLTWVGQTQRPPVNYIDPFGIGKQTVKKEDGHFKKPSQCNKFVNNQVSNQNNMISHLVPVKKEDGQQWSTMPTNTWLYSPMQQNKQNFVVTGSSELPSTSYAANSRIRKHSDTRSLKSKKRKLSTFERVPSRKEVTKGSSRLHDISAAELEWAHSVDRLPEKLNELADEIEDSRRITDPKRRLILTTQLMQMLFQPPPANVLAEDAITHCDVVTYYASKLALDGERSLRSQTSKSCGDQDLIKVIEGFIDRTKRLQDNILRLEKSGASILEVMMNSRELVKCSINNRFAKFHSRKRKVIGDTSSSATRKRRPQRYVKAIPMPEMVPEGQNCLIL